LQKSGMWKYCNSIDDKIKCDIYGNLFFHMRIMANVYLFHVHNIDDDKIDEVIRSNLYVCMMVYFTEEKIYFLKCKFCNETVINRYAEIFLKEHLLYKPSEVIQKLKNTVHT